MSNNEYGNNDIAIIGIGGRFPGASDMEDVWNIIQNGEEKITAFTNEDLEKANIPKNVYENSSYIKMGAVIDDIELFDAQFFGYHPKDAEICNPQHRIFLECAYEVLESAGYDSTGYNGRIGVFAGEGFNTYMFHIVSSMNIRKNLDDIQILLGNDKDFLSTNISYKLNLKGPSMTVQSACSTSLLGITIACQSLKEYQCDIALAGGIRLGIPQKTGYIYKEGSILSPDGHCRPFDEEANGTVGGNGAAIVALKRLEEAVTDGDYIYAVIKSTAVNNDGTEKIGYTAPSVDGQAEAIYEALELSGIDIDNIGYIETHGTGTKLGDPIEFEALRKVFETKTRKKSFCALGSLKANFGHMDAAAGAAGVIKAALTLKNKKIPPCVNFNIPNSKLNIIDSPFYIPRKSMTWESIEKNKRYADVSSFGIGGTNVHIVLEEAPEVETKSSEHELHIIPISAKSENALSNLCIKYEHYLMKNNSVNIADLAYTLQNGRKSLELRKAMICSNTQEMSSLLKKIKCDNREICNGLEKADKNILFKFEGQRALSIDMYKKMCKVFPVFKTYSRECMELFELQIGKQMESLVYSSNSLENDLLKETYISLPYIFTCEYAMAKTIIDFGILPDYVQGSGLGEYIAACIAGIFHLEDAIMLTASLGRLLEEKKEDVISEHLINSLIRRLKNIELETPRIPFLSASRETWITDENNKPNYWAGIMEKSTNTDKLMKILEEGKKKGIVINISDKNMLYFEGETQNSFSYLENKEEKNIELFYFYHLLAQIWCKGISINWSMVYKNEKRNRLPLPTYPFDRKPYWVDMNVNDGFKEVTNNIEKNIDMSKWFYTKFWKPAASVKGENLLKGIVVIFACRNNICTELIKQIDSENVICIYEGDKFEVIDDKTYIMNSLLNNELKNLFQIIFHNKEYPIKMVYMWGLGREERIINVENEIENQGFENLIQIAKVLGKLNILNPIDICVITNHIFKILESDTVSPKKSIITAPCLTIPQEYMNITCRCIDIEFKEESRDNDELILMLLNEIMFNSQESRIVYRKNQRFIQTYENLDLNGKGLIGSFKENGVYFIFGGLGLVGYSAAKYLAQKYNANLVLVGRTKLPDREEWDNLLCTEEQIFKKVSQLKKIEEFGSKILYYDGDICDKNRMKLILENASKHFGKFDGLIYSVGETGSFAYEAIQDNTKQHNRRQFHAKVEGLEALKEIFQDVKMDFRFIISSLSTILGGMGLTNYIAANIFLENYSETNGFHCISLDGWESLDTKLNPDNLALTSEEGQHVFEITLSKGQPKHMIVSVGNLLNRVKKWINPHNLRSIDEIQGFENVENMSEEKIKTSIHKIWEELLGIKNIGDEDSFFDLGGDSLLAAQIVYKMKSDLKFDISIKEFFERKTIDGMLNYIRETREKEQKILEALNQVKALSDEKAMALLDKIKGGSNKYGEDVKQY